MTTHTLSIPDWRPCSANDLVGRHWAQVSRLKRADADMVAGYALRQSIPVAAGRRRVSMSVTVAGRTGTPDADNLLKSLLDALVKARLLVDDSVHWCELGRLEVCRGAEARTVITLEDLDDERRHGCRRAGR